MGALFSKPSAPTPPPPPPTAESTAEITAKAERERAIRVASSGRAADLITGGQGVTDEYQSAKKKLLGA